MANLIAANVYRINQNDLPNVTNTAFNPSNIKVRAIVGSIVTAGASNTRMYSIIQEYPQGLQIDSTQSYVVETVAQLVTAAG